MAVGNVLANDTLNGVQPTPSTVKINVLTPVPPELTFDTATGDVDVVPGSAPGTYSFTYQICELATMTNCDPAVVTVTVVALYFDCNGNPITLDNDCNGTPLDAGPHFDCLGNALN